MKRTDDNPQGADRSVFEAVRAAWRTDWPRWVPRTHRDPGGRPQRAASAGAGPITPTVLGLDQSPGA
jgi:hypothetical protein